MLDHLRSRLAISSKVLEEINSFLCSPDNQLVSNLLNVIAKYGTIEEINQKAQKAAQLSTQMQKLKDLSSPYIKDLEWLSEMRDKKAFISIAEYRKKVLGNKAVSFNQDDYAVTLEISSCQYFDFLIEEAKKAIANKELMPGRYIRVRNMKEQEKNQGELIAMGAAMNIVGASFVESLDTRGTDGSNVHLGGPETITGYFGGVGQPNEYALKWMDEFLYYYTNYGIRQVLNINPGTVLVGYLMHRLGISNEFKISVFMGNDNPYSVLWTLMTAKLFSREDGTTPLIGFNFSNSINNKSIELCSMVRKSLNLEDMVRFEHHILETYKSIVRQPYDKTQELLEIAPKVKNISAKHEGGLVETEKKREHPSDILDYFMPLEDVKAKGLFHAMLQNYLDKHDGLNNTAQELTKQGLSVVAAKNLHY
ncbi:MAG: hypothetical protein HUU50_00580 [Candidatus Brocadiae bacterium]|nr:hypothetical protein [Candidatus Brocadiia bacterium]